MLKHSVAAVLVGGALITAASQPAHADDLRSYPGLMCERWAGAAGVVGPFGSTDNPSSTSSSVECPIVKNRQLPDRVSLANAYVADTNTSQDVACSLWAARRIAGGFMSEATGTRRSSGSAGEAQALVLGSLTPPIGGGGITTWFVYCNLPPNTSILNYSVGEPSP